MNTFVTVVIPAHNEEEAIGKVLAAIPTDIANHVVVCDNNSTDNTASIAASNGAQVVFEANRGYGAACLKALTSIPSETDIVVFLDGDFSDVPSEMNMLVEPIKQGVADLVLGSRTENALPGALTPQQKFGNWLATGLLRVIYKHKFSDLGPFRAIRRTTLDQLGMQDRGMGWTVEMQLKALRHKMKVLEVPVSYRKRVGQSKISGTLSGSFRAGCKILYLIGAEVFRKSQKSA